MPSFLWLFFGLFCLVGIGVFGFGLWGAYWSTAAASWPVTQGVIRKAELRESSDSDGSTWTVEVEYTYAVNGQAYEGSRLAFGYCGSSEQASHIAVHQKLQNAKGVDVRYDPDDPTNSCLSFGLHSSIKFLLIFGLTWLAFTFGISMLFWISSAGDAVLLDNLVTK